MTPQKRGSAEAAAAGVEEIMGKHNEMFFSLERDDMFGRSLSAATPADENVNAFSEKIISAISEDAAKTAGKFNIF